MSVKYNFFIFLLTLTVLFSCEQSATDQANKKKYDSVKSKKNSHFVKKKKNINKTIRKFDYNTVEWDEITYSDDTVVIDLRYANTNNFVKKKMYKCARCFLRPDVSKKLSAVNSEILKNGLRLKVFDCYRPKPVQEKLWKIMPDENYVAAPWKGSMHNRGIAVDLTIVDNNNSELDMGTPFDFFGEEAHLTYTNFNQEVLKNRNLLKTTMEKHGFRSIRTEWWHYSVPSDMNSISNWQWQCY